MPDRRAEYATQLPGEVFGAARNDERGVEPAERAVAHVHRRQAGDDGLKMLLRRQRGGFAVGFRDRPDIVDSERDEDRGAVEDAGHGNVRMRGRRLDRREPCCRVRHSSRQNHSASI